MKRIYFIRHAKSSWDDLSLADHDRPLNHRGKRDAPLMAAKWAERVEHIDLWLISTAKRARRTAKAFKKVISSNQRVKEPRIYHAYVEELINLIREQDDLHESCILFGHNPAFTYVHNHFTENQIANLPTCGGFELISQAGTWAEVSPQNTTVRTLIYPKMFG